MGVAKQTKINKKLFRCLKIEDFCIEMFAPANGTESSPPPLSLPAMAGPRKLKLIDFEQKTIKSNEK